jgi:ribosomal protein S18 acetylase RimI-like enzyme
MAASLIYRSYMPEDFDALYALEEACFQPPFRFGRRYMRSVVTRQDAATWIAEDHNGALAGFAIVRWESLSGSVRAYLETLEVSPDLRGQGTGGELLRRCEESARAAGADAMGLHVDAENEAAIALYRAYGFELIGREEGYYPQGRAAEVYAKKLTGTG